MNEIEDLRIRYTNQIIYSIGVCFWRLVYTLTAFIVFSIISICIFAIGHFYLPIIVLVLSISTCMYFIVSNYRKDIEELYSFFRRSYSISNVSELRDSLMELENRYGFIK